MSLAPVDLNRVISIERVDCSPIRRFWARSLPSSLNHGNQNDPYSGFAPLHERVGLPSCDPHTRHPPPPFFSRRRIAIEEGPRRTIAISFADRAVIFWTMGEEKTDMTRVLNTGLYRQLGTAEIYRSEKNIIDLFVMLLRFSSLITETIPFHKDYQVVLQNEKLYFRKRLLNALNELEALKPDVQRRLEELNRKNRSQVNIWGQALEDDSLDDSFVWPPVKKKVENNKTSQVYRAVVRDGFYRSPIVQRNSFSTNSREDQFRKFFLPPKEETLSRHSILGPNGLHGHWKPPVADRRIQYPSNLDLTPIEFPSLLQPTEDKPVAAKENGTSEIEKSMLEVLSLQDDSTQPQEEQHPMVSLDVSDVNPKMDIVKELSPPPVLAEVQDVHVTAQDSCSLTSQTVSLQDELIHAESPQEVHISTSLMDSFMRLAKSNTSRNLETCGVLAGSLKNRKFYVTALIIPKQESTSDSCQTTNEEEIFDYQDKQSLFPLGWIHTHPTQSCFMSSIDVHTHYSYQIMLPESIAIVMAPRDGSRTHGIFRLTTPGGMSVIRQCQQRGFHPHQQPPDGGPIYDHCSDVYMNPDLKFDVVDLR
ncbi:AMSH-like ubiquitin thiolesterase [Musa troglodytarum]|uniref:AMSH-like ubiquitin thiolesterase n=1 Tax=Musa troglodytarum TaxID=320322 RepID=A0A9E7I6K4_9LILI|nr:AMSH-like ubiquitin thiolesterase [Musa troglodytarum]